MTNRKSALRTAAICTPLVAALLYIALNWYRIEPGQEWVGAGEEARRNPYLAYTRLLDRLNGRVHALKGPVELDAIEHDATLLIASQRLAYVTPPRTRRLAAWVEAGGHIVIEVEPADIDDPLLEAFGIERVKPKPEARPRPGAVASKPTPPDTYAMADVDWPGMERGLRVRFGPRRLALVDRMDRAPLAQIHQRERLVGLSFDAGKGRVTVLPSFSFLANTAIGELDHAQFGWLVASRPEPAPIALFLRMDSPPFFDWLWREGWAVVIAATLLVVLWLGRVIPRFGPLAPEAQPARRSLLEHVAASGRFLWSRGRGRYLLDAVRERVLAAARRRGFASESASPQDVAAALAALAQVPEPAVRAAFTDEAAAAAQFTASAATLQRIEARLAQRGAVPPPPRKVPS